MNKVNFTEEIEKNKEKLSAKIIGEDSINSNVAEIKTNKEETKIEEKNELETKKEIKNHKEDKKEAKEQIKSKTTNIGKAITILMIIIILVVFLSLNSPKKKILGTWKGETGIIIDLYEDNNCNIEYPKFNIDPIYDKYANIMYSNCSYILDNKDLSVTYTTTSILMGTSISGEDTLNLHFSDDYKVLSNDNGTVTYHKTK